MLWMTLVKWAEDKDTLSKWVYKTEFQNKWRKLLAVKKIQHNHQLANKYHIRGQFDKYFNMSVIKKINKVLFLTWQPNSSKSPSFLLTTTKHWTKHTHTKKTITWRLQRINNRQIIERSKKLEKWPGGGWVSEILKSLFSYVFAPKADLTFWTAQ